jgi:IS5 family transposase
MSVSDFEYAGKRKQTRRERFLAEMDQVAPWGYTCIEKREEHENCEIVWQIAARRSTYSRLNKRGLMKNTAQLTTLFALSNLWMARKRLMGMGELRV